jgi:hypothetical protein
VTEQCQSVQPSVACVSSVLACPYGRSHYQGLSQRLTYSTISNSEPSFDHLQRHARQFPTLYGVLSGIGALNLLIHSQILATVETATGMEHIIGHHRQRAMVPQMLQLSSTTNTALLGTAGDGFSSRGIKQVRLRHKAGPTNGFPV